MPITVICLLAIHLTAVKQVFLYYYSFSISCTSIKKSKVDTLEGHEPKVIVTDHNSTVQDYFLFQTLLKIVS